jgi:hypothetical protein
MATSQNGWPVVGQSAVVDRAVLGVEFPNGWLKGDVDVVFTYLIGRLHREVEPIAKGGCWGWYVKPIEGSSTISNHASGTAIDYNAPNHPMGVRNTYGAADRVRIRAILSDLAGVVRWGGDYTGRPDDMHFEINATRSAVSRVADWIRDLEDDDMATPQEIVTTLLNTEITMANGSKKKLRDVWGWNDAIELDTRKQILDAIARDDIDEAAVVAGVLAGMNGDQIEQVIRRGMTTEARRTLAARLAA